MVVNSRRSQPRGRILVLAVRLRARILVKPISARLVGASATRMRRALRRATACVARRWRLDHLVADAHDPLVLQQLDRAGSLFRVPHEALLEKVESKIS